MSRIFSVRINIDDLSASLALALTDQERAAWSQGLIYGLGGGEDRPGMPEPFRAAWRVGRSAYDGARWHQDKSREGGKKSIQTHPENSIDARQPQRGPTESPPDPPPESPSDSPLEQSNNPIIEQSKNQKSSDPGTPEPGPVPAQGLAAQPKRGVFVQPTLEEVRAYIAEKGYAVDAEKWYAHYESNGWKVGKNPMKSWKAALVTWSKNDTAKPGHWVTSSGKVCPYRPDHPLAMDWWALNADPQDFAR